MVSVVNTMTIQEVLATHTPNQGRLVWNANDQEMESRLNALALNVRHAPYNAAGDGIADDRNAIQSAIDDCYVAGGGYVYLPAGTYIMDSGSLNLKDNVNLMGAGMFATTIKLGNGVNVPVISDDLAGVNNTYAFGRVLLSNLGIDGNQVHNPAGSEGIFTSAYFSTFENLYIRNCRTHGIRFGFEGLVNNASQNRVVGCRITNCADAGIYLDIKGVDHTISQNYIYDCDRGVVISNGGVRVVDNDIYGCQTAAVQVKQTSYGAIIAANDFNANKQHTIHVTRTNVSGSEMWGQILISGNAILGDFLAADNKYDAVYVETAVSGGLSNLTISGNKIFTLSGNRYRYGINLDKNVTQAKCTANHIYDAGTAAYHVGATCSYIEIDSIGAGAVGPPTIPGSGTPLTNPYHAPVTIHVSGGNVSSIAIDGTATGLTSGSFRLPARKTITLVYSAAPVWTWFAD